MLTTQVRLPMGKIADFCCRWKIIKLELFGSALCDDFHPNSDVDFLFTFSEDADWSFGQQLKMEDELSDIIGRPVDLVKRSVIENSENWYRREHILKSTVPIYGS